MGVYFKHDCGCIYWYIGDQYPGYVKYFIFTSFNNLQALDQNVI